MVDRIGFILYCTFYWMIYGVMWSQVALGILFPFLVIYVDWYWRVELSSMSHSALLFVAFFTLLSYASSLYLAKNAWGHIREWNKRRRMRRLMR